MEESLIARKLFVTAPGLDAVDSKVLRERCEVYGVVEEVISTIENTLFSLFCHQVTLLEEKGYGFVTFARKADALAALDALSGCLINGKRLIMKRKKRTSGDPSTDFACGVRFGSHRKPQEYSSTGKYSDIGGGATFAWGTCFTCGRPGHKMQECRIKFSYGKPECVNEDPDEDFKVYVENLPSDVAWQEVRELFEKEVGKVSYAMPRTLESGGEGCRGIIGFERRADQELAVLKMNGRVFKGKPLLVKNKVGCRAKDNEFGPNFGKGDFRGETCQWCENQGHWCGRSSRACFSVDWETIYFGQLTRPVDWETLQRAVASVAACLAPTYQLKAMEQKLKADLSKKPKVEEDTRTFGFLHSE